MTLPREDRTWTQGKIKRLFAIKHNGLHYCWFWTDEVPGRGVPFFPELAALCVVKCFSHENNWLMWCVVWINPTHLCFRLMSTSTRLLFKRASGGFEDLTALIAWCRNIFIPTALLRFLSQTHKKKEIVGYEVVHISDWVKPKDAYWVQIQFWKMVNILNIYLAYKGTVYSKWMPA